MGLSLKHKFGRRVKLLREAEKLTQEDLGGLCNRSTETISNIERGVNGPRFDLLEKLAKHLHCQVKELFIFE